jgi:hypothetical protein
LSAFVPWISASDLLLEPELELVVALVLELDGAAAEAELEVELELEPQPASTTVANSAIKGGNFRRITPPSVDGRHRQVSTTPHDGALRVNDHGRNLARRRSWSKYTARIRIAPMTTCCQND